MAVDAAGNLYVADANNRRVRRIDPAGIITTVAGNGQMGAEGDGGRATAARLGLPTGVAVDGAGNLYVADLQYDQVRRIDPAGLISTIAGTGATGFSGDGGPAAEARLNSPYALAADTTGNLYVTDRGNHRVRRIGPAGLISTIAGTGGVRFRRRRRPGHGGPARTPARGGGGRVRQPLRRGHLQPAGETDRPWWRRPNDCRDRGVRLCGGRRPGDGRPGSTTRTQWRPTRPAMSTSRTPTTSA